MGEETQYADGSNQYCQHTTYGIFKNIIEILHFEGEKILGTWWVKLTLFLIKHIF